MTRESKVRRIILGRIAGLDETDLRGWLVHVLMHGFVGYTRMSRSRLDAEYESVTGESSAEGTQIPSAVGFYLPEHVSE